MADTELQLIDQQISDAHKARLRAIREGNVSLINSLNATIEELRNQRRETDTSIEFETVRILEG